MGYTMDNYILEKMEDEKESAINKILSLINHTTHIDDIVNTLVYAYLEGYPSALKLMHDAELNQLEYYALLDDQESFCDKYNLQISLEIGEAQYDARY